MESIKWVATNVVSDWIAETENCLSIKIQAVYYYLCVMAEKLIIAKGSKSEMYQTVLPQIAAVIEGEPDLIANLANISACLKEQFGWLWVGFYIVKGDELVLGPFQGPLACTRIREGKGVCGTSWAKSETIIVADVEHFPGHIACNSSSRSEIVVPVIRDGQVVAVLDVDSTELNHFDKADQEYLEKLIALIDWQ